MKVMTLNINYYGSTHGPWEERRQIIADAIRSAEPDMVVMQAVARDPSLEGGSDQAAQLSTMLHGYRPLFRPVVTYENGKAEGMAFLSRANIISTRTRPLTFREGLEDPNRRAVVAATVRIPESTSQLVNIINAHFSWVTGQASDNVRETVQFLRNLATGPALLAGDFNTQPGSEALEPLRAEGWSDLWASLHPGAPGCTFESNQPSIRIDYFWANPALAAQVKSIDIVAGGSSGSGARASNHLGLLVDFGQSDRR